jgi:hypothetical protein
MIKFEIQEVETNKSGSRMKVSDTRKNDLYEYEEEGR